MCGRSYHAARTDGTKGKGDLGATVSRMVSGHELLRTSLLSVRSTEITSSSGGAFLRYRGPCGSVRRIGLALDSGAQRDVGGVFVPGRHAFHPSLYSWIWAQ